MQYFHQMKTILQLCPYLIPLKDATEKVFILHKAVQYKVFLFVLIYYIMCIKIVFQWRPYRGEGILATVVKYILAAHLSGHQWCQGKSPEYFICIFVFQINRLGTSLFVKYSPLLYAHFIRKYHNLPDNNYE